MDHRAVFVGMDLGTFKTAVATAHGVREVIPTAVGKPKDHVARTLLGRDTVFGNDLAEHRLALDIIRPFEKGALKYLDGKDVKLDAARVAAHKEAARQVVEHAVAITRPPKGLPVFGVIGAPSRASVQSKAVILEAASTTFDAALIVSEPFSIAYGCNKLSDALVVDIGAGTIDLCPLRGTLPTDEEQVTIPLGGDFVDEHLDALLRQAHPEAQFSRAMLREIKERHGGVIDTNERAIVTLPCRGKPTQLDVTGVVREACRRIVNPIVEGIRDLIARHDPEFQPRLLANILLGGGGSQIKGLDRALEEGLREYGQAKVKRVPDPVYAGAIGALKLAMGLPGAHWEKLATPKGHAYFSQPDTIPFPQAPKVEISLRAAA